MLGEMFIPLNIEDTIEMVHIESARDTGTFRGTIRKKKLFKNLHYFFLIFFSEIFHILIN